MSRTGISRMPGVDAGYLYLETPSMHMHTLKIAILEPTTELTFENLVEAMLARLERLPPLRKRVVPVPFWLNHPVWVTQAWLDPDRHFVAHRVPGAGTMADLEELIGEIGSAPLDRSAPLWEVHYCHGLADGRVGIVAKMHHSLADGMAANALLANVTDVRTADGPAPAPEPEPNATVWPTDTELVTDALRDATVQIGLLPSLLWRTVRGVASVVRYRRAVRSRVPLPVLDAPRTSFNGPLTPRRSFATVSLSLAECKRVRHQHEGVTLNDVVLAVVAGALRRWMDERGERPSRALTASVPVGIDAPGGEPRLIGNRVSNVFTTLATDVDDPVERLTTISQTTHHAKEIQQRIGATMLTEWTQFTPPAPLGWVLKLYSRWRAARLHPPPFNVIVSNVPGPREPVNVAGARLGDVFSVGPLVDGVGLNVTVWSYVDRMNFSLLACPDLLPNVEAVAAHFPAALAELDRDHDPGTSRPIDDGDEPYRRATA